MFINFLKFDHITCHLYVSVTNTKAYATLVTEHIYFGYVLFYFFLFLN